MRRIDELDKLPGDVARVEKGRRDLAQVAEQNQKDYLKQDFFSGTSERREKQVNTDRRKFLEMIGKAGISTKMLQASTLLGGVMANRYAVSQDENLNKRVVFCYLNSGAVNGQWLPGSQTSMNRASAPYGPVADLCNFREVNVISGGHENPKCSLGGFGDDTMDKRIAAYLGNSAPYKSIYLSAQRTGAACSNMGTDEANPATAYSNLFESPVPAGTTDNTYLTSYNAQIAALEPLRAKLSLEERERLQAHEDALLKIRNNMTAQIEGNAPDPGACKSTVTGIRTANIIEHGKTQADIIVAAFQCGLTKVATLQLGGEQGGWRGHNTAYQGDAHGSCHSVGSDTGPNNELVAYLSQVPVYLLDKLRRTMGPDGKPLIETTVFVQVTCMGNGMDHSPGNGPFIVASRMPGFRTGFSASGGSGTTKDLNNAIPAGMGLQGMVTPLRDSSPMTNVLS